MKKILLLLVLSLVAKVSYGQRVFTVYQDCNVEPYNVDLTTTTGQENSHEWVDLGLSVRWASMNIGASSNNEYGKYFALPSTAYNVLLFPIEADFAHKEWGGKWRMPTKSELEELLENCIFTPEISASNAQGVRVTSKINGKSIFLPMAGYDSGYYPTGCVNGYKGTCGIYPCSVFSSNNVSYNSTYQAISFVLSITGGTCTIGTYAWGTLSNNNGVLSHHSQYFPIRAVCDYR